ncbi:13558_t:CDS:2, partial [Gigaspora margarita]
ESLKGFPGKQELFYFTEEKYEDLIQHLTKLLDVNEFALFALKYRGATNYSLNIHLIEPHYYAKLDKFIPLPKLSSNKVHGNEKDEVPLNSESNSDNKKTIRKNRLSRFNCIATLFVSAECTIAQDIFQTISQFLIAFPLLIPKLDKAEKYKVMLYSFKMIVAVQIGTNSKDPENKDKKEKYTIYTNEMHQGSKNEMVCKMVKNALDFSVFSIDINNQKTEFTELKSIINVINDRTCCHIKLNIMTLQKKQIEDESNYI